MNTAIRTCTTHGNFESHDSPVGIWTRCPVCAAEQTAKREAAEVERKQQQAEERYLHRVADSGIPYRFSDRTLQSFIAETEAQKVAREFSIAYADGFDSVYEAGRCAIFVGRPGTGKTHLACAIGMQIMGAGYTAAYATASGAIRRIRATWSSDRAESDADAFGAFTRPALLVIDEIGVQAGTENERQILFELINIRYQQMLPTILISNHDTAIVSDYIGERAFDRMREGGGQVVVFDWSSYRK